MEQIKKKLATLKEEKEVALEKAEEATQQKKEAEAKADAVSRSLSLLLPLSLALYLSNACNTRIHTLQYENSD